MEFTIQNASPEDRRISDFVAAWNVFERSQAPYHVEFSDFNVSRHTTEKSFSSRLEAKEELDALRRLRAVENCEPTANKLRALSAVLHDIETGCTQPIAPYLQETMNIRLNWIDDRELASLRQTLEKKLNALGINFDNAEEGLKNLSGTVPVNEAGEFVDEYLQKARREIEAVVGAPFNFEVTTKTGEYDERWRGRIGGFGRDFLIEYNTRMIQHLSVPMLRLIAYHEMAGHGGQYGYIADNVESGKWPIHAGITTMIDEGVLQAEALAQTIPIWLDDREDESFTASLLLEFYDQHVLNNAYMVGHEQGTDEARNYMMAHSPFRSEIIREARLKGAFENPKDRIYLPIYPAGVRLMVAAMQHTPEENFNDILKALYTQKLSPGDLNGLASRNGVPAQSLLNTPSTPQGPGVALSPDQP